MTTTVPPFAADSPFAAPSTLPFGTPHFDRIRDADFQPAIEEGMRRHIAEVAAIASQSDSPTFDNTIVALERSGEMLTRVLRTFYAITSANTNDLLQAVQTEEAPRLAAHSDEIYLDAKLFQRVKCIYDARDRLGLTPEQFHLVERYHIDFVRAGARLSEPDKATLRALNQDESMLVADFQNRILAATKAGGLVFDDGSELVGLNESDLSAAAETAKERGLAGKWVLALQNTTQQPAQESLRRREVRQRLFEASIHRADRGEHDTRAIVQRIAQIRAERAKLLGFESCAAFTLDDQMAKTAEAAIKLLTDIAPTAVAKARAEAAKIQSLIDAQRGGFRLEPWDWQFYSEQVRREEYDLDEAQIKPYFECTRVLRDGVFYAASQLYGLAFVQRHDLPVYHPDVWTYEVFDGDGTPVALLFVDLFKRDSKVGGAWMDSLVDQSRLLGRKPVITNVMNFPKPAPGLPSLIGFDEVLTMFHEFGHALHGMLSDVVYPTLTGTNVPRDFVEFPSQFNEHWALDPTVLANYARHHETGAPMPPELVDKIKKSRTFNQGFALTEYVSGALLDMAWHTLAPGEQVPDVQAFEAAALQRFKVDVREVPPRYHSTYFSHIWDGGYNAGYYAYLWAEVLDHDAYAWFKERGGLSRENGRIFREMILSRGGTRDAAELYRAFRGRDPVVEPLLVARGLIPES